MSTLDCLSQATQAYFFFIPYQGKIYPNLEAPTQLLSDAGMKWLSDTNRSLCTAKAANPKFCLKGKREANGLTPLLLKHRLALAGRVIPLLRRGLRGGDQISVRG